MLSVSTGRMEWLVETENIRGVINKESKNKQSEENLGSLEVRSS